MKKGRFLLCFLLVFGAGLMLWQATGAARWYVWALLGTARWLGPLLHGWVLESGARPDAAPLWVQGERQVQAAVQFDALAVGVVLVTALLLSTPDLPWRRRLRLLATGVTLSFALNCLVVSLFPLLVFYNNPFTDVLGTFLGVVTFVGAPVIIWFTLTYQELQQLLRRLR